MPAVLHTVAVLQLYIHWGKCVSVSLYVCVRGDDPRNRGDCYGLANVPEGEKEVDHFLHYITCVHLCVRTIKSV